MEDVPVKLHQPYAPPASVFQLPRNVVKKLTQQHNDDNAKLSYDFGLERDVLAKWHNFQHTTQREDQARMQRRARYEEELQRAFQAKEKALLGAVSYPSTEDLCSETSSDGGDAPEAENDGQMTPFNATNTTKDAPTSSFNDILQPTVLSEARRPAKPDTVLLPTSINYADFEYNSSPFDNIELKSINDLDMLAQVLHNVNMERSKDKQAHEEKVEANQVEEKSKNVAAVNGNSNDNGNAIDSAELESYDFVLDAESCPTTIAETKAQLEKINFDVSDINHIPNGPATMTTPISNVYAGQQQHPSYQHNYHSHYNNQLQPATTMTNNSNGIRFRCAFSSTASTLTPSSQQHAIGSASFFNELESSGQQLAQQISSMGFPLERVAKTVRACGPDDKKIIEHLLILSELMDLGFDEAKVAAALVKFDNNKDKAIDFLIS